MRRTTYDVLRATAVIGAIAIVGGQDKPTLSTVVSEVKNSKAAVVSEVKKNGAEGKAATDETNIEIKKFVKKQASASTAANASAEALQRTTALALAQAILANDAAQAAAKKASDQADMVLKQSLAAQQTTNQYQLGLWTLIATSVTSIVLAIVGRSRTHDEIKGVHKTINGQLDKFKSEAAAAAREAETHAYYKGLRKGQDSAVAMFGKTTNSEDKAA
jgi:hypothetical protein